MSTNEEMVSWINRAQATLWYDLDDAIRTAIDGKWSNRAGNIAYRIVAAARLVGPTHYYAVPYSLLAGGVYESVLKAGGITPEMPDAEEWKRLDLLMSSEGRGRAAAERARFAGTVEKINSPEESYWINGGDEDAPEAHV